MTDAEVMRYIDVAVEKAMQAMRKAGALKDMDDVNYANISYMLSDYYSNGEAVEKITKVLNSIKFDEYFEIIPMYYGDGMKIDEIAKRMEKDISTIVRNKKRLCLQIYTMLI